MVFPMVLFFAAAVFLTQLVFCFYAEKLWIKLLPIILALSMDFVCWVLYFLGIFSEIYGGDFAAFIYGIVLLLVAAMAAIAWAIYGIMKIVQKRGKNFVM